MRWLTNKKHSALTVELFKTNYHNRCQLNQMKAFKQTFLDENNEPTPSFTTKVETSIPEEDNNRSSQENRVKNNRLAYAGAWNKFKRFFTFFGERFSPTDKSLLT